MAIYFHAIFCRHDTLINPSLKLAEVKDEGEALTSTFV